MQVFITIITYHFVYIEKNKNKKLTSCIPIKITPTLKKSELFESIFSICFFSRYYSLGSIIIDVPMCSTISLNSATAFSEISVPSTGYKNAT